MEIFDKFTGKTIESKLDEYSSVYGEVLLGIHREVEGQDARLEELAEELGEFQERLNEGEARYDADRQHLKQEVDDLRRSISIWRWTAGGALILAVAALVLAL